MPEINVEIDLTSVNDQIVKLVDELNKINAGREQLVQQIQNLNGVAMYLRGKIEQPDEGSVVLPTEDPDLDRSSEYPEDETT